MSTDSEHLKWIEDRLVNVYGESPNVDFIIRLRKIRAALDEGEAECSIGVGSGGGNLYLHGSYEATKVAQEKFLELERLRHEKPPAAAGHCEGCCGVVGSQPIYDSEGIACDQEDIPCPGIPAAQPAVSEEDIKLIEDAADAVPPALREGESILLERLDALAARLRREEKL